MLRSILSVAVVAALAASSQAALIFDTTKVATTGIAGMSTYTVTATAAAGEKIIGFDFVGNGTNYGILGPMNQVNPAGLPTVYADNNALFGLVGADVSQDSQFKVVSTTGIAINSSESTSLLKSAFNISNVASATNSLAFLQVATAADPATVRLYGTITVQNALGENRLEAIDQPLMIPEPAALSLIGLAMVGALGFARRRSA